MDAISINSVAEMRKHLIGRCVNFNLHTPHLSDNIATFMLYNLSGQIVGYQRYNPSFPSAFPGDGKQHNLRDRRYYNYVSSGQIGIFGLESLKESSSCIFVTEGVFDCCRLTNRGASAVAVLTNNPSTSMKNFLSCLGKPIVAICDSDHAGKKLRMVGNFSETVQGGKDLGECGEHFVEYILKKYT